MQTNNGYLYEKYKRHKRNYICSMCDRRECIHKWINFVLTYVTRHTPEHSIPLYCVVSSSFSSVAPGDDGGGVVVAYKDLHAHSWLLSVCTRAQLYVRTCVHVFLIFPSRSRHKTCRTSCQRVASHVGANSRCHHQRRHSIDLFDINYGQPFD